MSGVLAPLPYMLPWPSPQEYGARGDGVTDDTTALNAWITAVKASRPNQLGSNLSFVFDPNKIYLVSGPLNFGFAFASGNNPTFSIIGNGSTVKGTTSGPAIIDCINFGYGSSIQDLKIVGVSGGSQGYGLVFGYSQGSGSYGYTDTFVSINVSIQGYFQYACKLNRGSDTSVDYSDNNQNMTSTNTGIDIGDSGFCTVVDSQGLWPLTSNICTIGSLSSANAIDYSRYACLDQSSYGSPFWIDTNASVRFYGTYANSGSTTPTPGCVLYILQTLQGGSPRLEWHTHMETLTSLNHAFYFYAPWATSGSPAIVTYNKFQWFDPGYQTVNSGSALGSSTYVTYIRLSDFYMNGFPQGSSGPLFDTPSKYLIIGTIYQLPSAAWSPPSTFDGVFHGTAAYSAYTWGAGNAFYSQIGTPGTITVGTTAFNWSSTLNVTGTLKAQNFDVLGGSVAGKTTGYISQGLDIGWNYSNGGGEVDLFVGPGGGAGGYRIYQTNGSGTLVNTTPLLSLSGTGNLAVSGFVSITQSAVVASGTNFATAAQLTAQFSDVYSGTGGVILPAGFGIIFYVQNTTGAIITVYTPTGASLGTIANGATSKWFASNSANYVPV